MKKAIIQTGRRLINIMITRQVECSTKVRLFLPHLLQKTVCVYNPKNDVHNALLTPCNTGIGSSPAGGSNLKEH